MHKLKLANFSFLGPGMLIANNNLLITDTQSYSRPQMNVLKCRKSMLRLKEKADTFQNINSRLVKMKNMSQQQWKKKYNFHPLCSMCNNPEVLMSKKQMLYSQTD